MPMYIQDCTGTYVKLLRPEANKKRPGSAKKYSLAAGITHENMKTPWFRELNEAMLEVMREAFGKRAEKLLAPLVPGGPPKPWRMDVESVGLDPKVFGCFVNLNSDEDNKPEVIGRNKEFLTTKDEVYSGCRFRVSVNPYSYDNESTGGSFGLRHVQRIAKGPRLDGKKAAADEFGDDLPPLPDDDLGSLE